jgi:uncharacterized damage-inducible protein DinB
LLLLIIKTIGMQKSLLLLALFISSISMAQQVTFKGAFLEKWNNSRDYLIAVAEAMPEEHYNYKPTKRQRSFKEQLLHIQGNINWLDQSYFSKSEDTGDQQDDTGLNKAKIIELLHNTFDTVYRDIENSSPTELKESVRFFAGPKSKLQIMNLLQDHVTHHRGQLLVYLSLKNVTPPSYSGW